MIAGEFGIVYKAHLVRPDHILEERISKMAVATPNSDKVVAVKTLHGKTATLIEGQIFTCILLQLLFRPLQ